MHQTTYQLELQQAFEKKQANKAMIASIAGSVLGGATSAAGAFCHAAAEYFGWFTPDWFAARSWIVDGWHGRTADLFRAFYFRHSSKLAWTIRNVPGMRALWKPFFVKAARLGGAQ